MKIAFIVGKCCPGGIVSYVKEYGKNLIHNGNIVDVYVHETDNRDYLSLVEDFASNVIQIPSLRSPAKSMQCLSRHLKKGRYDIAHSFLNTLNFVYLKSAKNAKIPIRIAENLSSGHKSEPKTLIKNLIKPFGKINATHICANSQLSAIWLYGKNQLSDCEIIANPINVSDFYPDESLRISFRDDYKLKNSLVVGCVARFERQKNLFQLIDIFETLHTKNPNSKLLIMGHGSQESELLKAITNKHLSDEIILLPADTDRNAFYNAIDAFVLPSIYEGLPIVALEAQAAGLPCILSSEITRECALGKWCAFLDLSDDESKWADEIVRLASNTSRDVISDAMESSIFESNLAYAHLDAYYQDLLNEVRQKKLL